MKKIIAIGDTHGRSDWKTIVERHPDAEKVILLGDYFDTHEYISPEEQIKNFIEIVEWKRANKEKAVLLIGNHDFHYLPVADGPYSGYQRDYAVKIGALVQNAIDDGSLQMAHEEGRCLFSHAGVTKTWARNNGIIEEFGRVAGQICGLFVRVPTIFRFTAGPLDDLYGDETCQTPIWVRPRRGLMIDPLPGYDQVVGHTQMDGIQMPVVEGNRLCLIDTLGTEREYLIIEDDKYIVAKI